MNPSEENTHSTSSKQEPRKSLIDTAIKFLVSPKVVMYNEKSKRSFLEKKGLTQEEIEMAMNQASLWKNSNETQIATLPQLTPPAVPQRNSIWMTFQTLAHLSILMSGIGYGFHYIYKFYIGPYLTGRKPKSSYEKVIEVQQSVMSVLNQIHTTLERMDRNVLEHNQILKELKAAESLAKESHIPALEELKTEIATIKGLLINRQSFRPPPVTCSSIPKWQIMSQGNDQATDILTNGQSMENNSNQDFVEGRTESPEGDSECNEERLQQV